MKFCITLLCLHLAFCASYAQKQDYNWTFGSKAGIYFNDLITPIPFNSQSYHFETAASISDRHGNLLFYVTTINSNVEYAGALIYGNNNSQIENADSIKGLYQVGSGAIIIPDVENENKYYVFCLASSDIINCSTTLFCLRLYYSIVEMINDTLVVTQKNIPIVQEELDERLAAVKHANGKDWWILVHQYGYGSPVTSCSNRFYKVLLTANGPQHMGEQDIGTLHCHRYSSSGTMNFSKDGTMLAVAITGQGTVDLFDFNRCTGNLSNYRTVDVSNVMMDPYSCEFSSESNFLYVSGFAVDNVFSGIGGLYQYDLNAVDISSSKVALWENSNSVIGTGQLQIAPNNKIYMAVKTPDTSSLGSYISVINFPDSLGLTSGFQLYGFYLGDSARSTFSLPNMSNYNLGPGSVYAINAGLSDTMVFCSDQTSGLMLGSPQEDNVVYSWSPAFFISDTTIAQPLASPTKDTWYYMTVRDTVSCNVERRDSVFVEVKNCSVGISEHSNPEIKIYPNPAHEYLIIEGVRQPATLQLFDLAGKIALQADLQPNENRIEIKHLASGVYIYKVAGAAVVGKLFIEK